MQETTAPARHRPVPLTDDEVARLRRHDKALRQALGAGIVGPEVEQLRDEVAPERVRHRRTRALDAVRAALAEVSE